MKDKKINWATCQHCKKKMSHGNGCTFKYLAKTETSKAINRIPYEDPNGEDYDCHDCNVSEGQIHHEGCDMERCPNCKGQLLSCDCTWGFIRRVKKI